MLKRLKLKNLALIEIIEINFQKGLNVFTGESGSGKSLILDSLDSLFGGTNIPLKHLIRLGKNECLIEAEFNMSPFIRSWLMANNIQILEDNLTIIRTSLRKGSKIVSKYKINNNCVKKKLLEKLGPFLLDIAGQNDKFLFNSQDYLRKIIDDFNAEDLKSINQAVQQTFFKLISMQKEISFQLSEVEKKKDNHFANLKILQILEAANLDDKDEIIKLKSKQLKLSNNYEFKNALNLVLTYLSDFRSENNSVNFLLFQSIKQLNKIIKYDESFNDIVQKLINTQAELEDVITIIINHLEFVDNPEENLNEVQSRLFKLQNLEKSFSLELPELISKRDELRKIQLLDCKHEEIKNLQNDYSILNHQFKKILKKQSDKRKKIALEIEKLVSLTLKELGLVDANFVIQLTKKEPNYTGDDSLKFLFAANPDQELAPISDVISGGEMSRFLLALKFIVSNEDTSLFFDEIDNGLSGKSLLSTINLIKKIASNQQTLCITHNPLLAACANVHYKVKKNINNGLTSTSLIPLLTKNQKKKELVELIGGGFEEANNYALTLINKAAA